MPHALPPGEGGLAPDEVMQILPHRYPFLLVDRIIGFEGEQMSTMNGERHRRVRGAGQRAFTPKRL